MRRLPPQVEELQREGWRFLACSALWDADDLERLAQASGLYAISPSYAQSAPQPWWKAYAQSYLKHQDPVAAVAAIGEPTFQGDWRDRKVPASSEGVMRREARSLVSSRRGLLLQEWSVKVHSEDLLRRINVLFLLRLAEKAHRRFPSRLNEITLSARESRLVCRGQGLPFQMPASGTWPSPVAVNAKRFIEVVREVFTPLVHLVFGGHRLWVNGFPIPAREV